MRPALAARLVACALALASAAGSQAPDAATSWPQWRGPLATGEAPHGNPPVRWDERTHVRWKVAIPGLGHATPVVWGDRVFVQTATPAGAAAGDRGLLARVFGESQAGGAFRYEILALARRDGRVLWRRTARTEAPHESRHQDGSWASASPLTDGEHVFAFFGSRGLFCYDMDGALQWQKDLGDMRIRFGFGEGSSPALHGGRLVVQWDHEGQSFLAALDKRTGRELWRANRDEGTSWATPLVVVHAGRAQVITSAQQHVRSYDLETGTLLWQTRGMTANPIPTPVAGGGVVYVMGGFRESVLQAVSLDAARGDAARSRAVLWEYDQDTPYVPSPLLYGGALYFLKSNQNILTVLDARTGAPLYRRQRLEGITGVYASPVAASGRVYVAGRNGTTLVLKHGPRYEVLAANVLDDRFDASPAIAGHELYLRGHRSLYCLSANDGG
jgi:outer membrane protein assembly factor BamB